MNYVYIGKFMGTHGLNGEIKFKSTFPYLDKVFKSGFSLYLGDNKEKVTFSSYRTNNKIYLVLLENINYDRVSKYINFKVYVDKNDLKLEENSYVIEDFLNKEAFYKDKKLGIITDITDYGMGNLVINIEGDNNLLIPYNKDFIEKVSDKIYFKNLEAFIDEN